MNTVVKSVAIVVAHPDDETLWTGGTLIDHPDWNVFIGCLCRKTDAERAEKFGKVLEHFGAKGKMENLDDGPAQKPLPEKVVQQKILKLLPHKYFDILITHSPDGEYTRHRRHEETSKAVIKLWHSGKILAKELWLFAYEDGNRMYFPKAVTTGVSNTKLSKATWQQKYDIITKIYGFDLDSWEAMTTPKSEAFREFVKPEEALELLTMVERRLDESTGVI
jgi:LmbE family N-acetylglucosaminyl deacetylase